MGSIQEDFTDIDAILKNMKDIVWIEIGVHKGINAENVLDKYDIKKIYLIDPFVPLPYLKKHFGTKKTVNKSKVQAHKRMDKHGDKVIFIEDFSENVFDKIDDNSCTVLFIDGNHSYESVLKDLYNYVPKIKSGGLIIGDDYNEAGVEKAIREYSTKEHIDYCVEQVEGKTSKFWFIKEEEV